MYVCRVMFSDATTMTAAIVPFSYSINQSINLYSPMQLQANDKKEWQAARTGNSPTKLATLRQKDRQITTVHITTQNKGIWMYCKDADNNSVFACVVDNTWQVTVNYRRIEQLHLFLSWATMRVTKERKTSIEVAQPTPTSALTTTQTSYVLWEELWGQNFTLSCDIVFTVVCSLYNACFVTGLTAHCA